MEGDGLGFNLQREDLELLSGGGSGDMTSGFARKPANGLWCSWQGEQREKQFGGDIKVEDFCYGADEMFHR